MMMMKVDFILFVSSLCATCIDAWSARSTGTASVVVGHPYGSTFGKRDNLHYAAASKARGSPLWATGYDYYDNDDEKSRKQYRNIRSSQRHVKELMTRGELIKEQIEESSYQSSFVWLSDQLVSLTTHLNERYQEMRELAYRQGNYLSEQDTEMLTWLQQELEAVHAQLEEYGRIVAATLHETPDDYALQRELAELAELSQQIQLALGSMPDSERQEMADAYAKTQSSLGRLNDLRQELADIETTLDKMENESTHVPQEEELYVTAATPLVTAGGPPPGIRTRPSSTQLQSHLEQLSGDWQMSEQETPVKPKFQPPQSTLDEDLSLYDMRTQKVANAAAAGKSRWGNMENQLAAVLAAQISNQPLEEVLPSAAFGEPPTDTSLYDKRTQTVASAAAAGKSRWGVMENQRATMLSEGVATTTMGYQQEEFRVKPDSRTPLGVGIKDLYDQQSKNVASAPREGRSPMADSSPSSSSSGFVTEVDSQSPGIVPGFGQRTQQLAARNGSSGGQDASTPPSPSGASLYRQRSDRVAASASAGNSRWGAMETDRVSSGAPIGATKTPMMPSGTSGYNGDTAPAQQQSFARGDTRLYDLRAEQVAASAAAGQSRWGSMETEKAINAAGLNQALSTLAGGIPEAPYVPPSESSSFSADSSIRSIPADATLYDLRNSQVTNAAAAGMSRWGTMETEKATNAFGLKQALDTLGPRAQEFVSRTSSPPPPPVAEAQAPPPVAPQPSTAPQPKGSSVAEDPMASLAREWAAMNREPDSRTSYQPPPPQAAYAPQPAAPRQASTPVQPKGSAAVEDPMDRLAREWAAMNREPDSRASYRPPPPQPQAPPPYVPPPFSQTRPPREPARSAVTMDQLAREWASLNSDAGGMDFMPPPPHHHHHMHPPPPHMQSMEPPMPPPRAIPNDWERLAQEWADINRDRA